MATKQERIVLDTARKVVPADVTLTVEHGGKHPCIVFTRGTRFAKMPFACSPRADDGAVRNYARQGTNRALATLAMAA
jgi:hypothetical protein